MNFNSARFGDLVKYHFPKTTARKQQRYVAVINEFVTKLLGDYGADFRSIEAFFSDVEKPSERATFTTLQSCIRDVQLCTNPERLAGCIVNVLMAIDDVATFLYETFDFDFAFDSARLERITYVILVTSAVSCVDKYTWETLPTPATAHFRLYFDRERYIEMVNQSRATWSIDENVAIDKLHELITFDTVDKKQQRFPSLVEQLLDDLLPA